MPLYLFSLIFLKTYQISIFQMIFGFLGIIIPSVLLHFREVQKFKLEVKKFKYKFKSEQERSNEYKKKSEFLPRIMRLGANDEIQRACHEVFKKTKANSFLLFVGVNGKNAIGSVTCIMGVYENEENHPNPTVIYKNVDIKKDEQYKDMLKWCKTHQNELYRVVSKDLPTGVLQIAYLDEDVNYSRVGFIDKKAVDNENDFLIYYSFRTEDNKDFTALEEKRMLMSVNAIIKPGIQKFMN